MAESACQNPMYRSSEGKVKTQLLGQLKHDYTYQDQLHSSTETGSGSFIFSGPAIVRQINHRKAVIVKGSHDSAGVETSFVQTDTNYPKVDPSKLSLILMVRFENSNFEIKTLKTRLKMSPLAGKEQA